MARTTTIETTAFAHCANPRCDGHTQTEVPAVKDTVEHTYIDSGGDMPGVEKSQVHYRFANDDDASCPVCDGPRDLTDQRRVRYENLSGKAQDGLLQYKPPELV